MLSFSANNRQKVTVKQYAHDGNVHILHDGLSETITPGDFVMLLNLYSYIKDNDIQNDFINPHGKNAEAL